MPDEMREKLSDELVDELLAGAKTEEEIVGPGGLLGLLCRTIRLPGTLAPLHERSRAESSSIKTTRRFTTPPSGVTS